MQRAGEKTPLAYLSCLVILLMLACSSNISLSTRESGDKATLVVDGKQTSADGNPVAEGILPGNATGGAGMPGDAGMPGGAGMTGSSCSGTTESFSIPATYRGLLDILIVIDGSPDASMAERRRQAAQRLRPLIARLGDSDYQVAVISSDLEACLNTVITKSTPNAVETLVSAVATGPTTSTGDFATMKLITGLTKVKKATWDGTSVVNDDWCSDSWLRSNSVVAMIVISDKKHMCCHSHACTMPDIENALRSIGRIGSSSSQRKLFRLYGLLNQTDEYTDVPSEYTTYSTADSSTQWYVDWRDFQDYTISGESTTLVDFVKSIDDPNYDDIFNSIASDIVTSLGDTFTLSQTHDNRCVEVYLTSSSTQQKLSSSEYELSGRTLKIKRVLTASDTQVSITYSH